MAVDTPISGLNAITGSTVASDDQIAISDTSASETKNITVTEFTVAMIAQGIIKFQIGDPASAINNNECYIWLDNTVSPQTLNVKSKDNAGNIFAAVL